MRFWTLAPIVMLAAPLAVAAAPPPAETGAGLIRVPRGTPLKVAFQYGVSARAAKTGDRIFLRVTEPVSSRGKIVIPAGSVVEAVVSNVRAPGDYGRAGALEIDAEFVRVGEDRLPLRGAIGSRGADNRASVTDGVVTVPFGSLGRGKSTNIEAGTAFVVYTARDY